VTDSFVVEPLSSNHNRLAFSCGVDALDRYLHTQASQDVRRRISNCFVAVPSDSAVIAGYYTLSAASIPIVDLPPEQTKRLPRYPVLPAALIGRLAVDHRYTGRSLGSALLFDAIQRVGRADPAVFALIVDAKNESAATFYRHFGFEPFASVPMSFFLPMATAVSLL
jgi:ribosomal protein S18 acetylase RimI-like enzyme